MHIFGIKNSKSENVKKRETPSKTSQIKFIKVFPGQ